MPMDTVIVGDERGHFTYRSGNTAISCRRTGYLEAVALVFAQDRDKPSGTVLFIFLTALAPDSQCYSHNCYSTNLAIFIIGEYGSILFGGL